MTEWLFELVMAPISLVATEAIVFAATAPLPHVYIAMVAVAILVVAIIHSMIPKRKKVVAAVVQTAEPTEEDEREAMEIIRRAIA